MKKILFVTLVCLISGFAIGQKTLGSAQTIKEKLNDEYCTGLFKSSEGVILDLLHDDMNLSAQSYFNILNWLEARVAGLHIATLLNGTRVPMIRGQRATIYVDEMPVSPSYLNALPASDIAMIKVIKGPFLAGAYGAGGALAIYTIRAEEEED
jgi:hypothetical protein